MYSTDTENVLLKKTNDKNIKEVSEISEIIENSNIEKDAKEKIIGIIQQEVFKGPIPHPQILKQYEEVHPGFADTIVNMAVEEQKHRHEMNRTIIQSEVSLNTEHIEVIQSSIKLKIRLQIFGFILTFMLVFIGAACIFLDKNIGGITTFVLAIGSCCWTIFYGKKNNKNEEMQNDKN